MRPNLVVENVCNTDGYQLCRLYGAGLCLPAHSSAHPKLTLCAHTAVHYCTVVIELNTCYRTGVRQWSQMRAGFVGVKLGGRLPRLRAGMATSQDPRAGICTAASLL